jgi:hypothetical protein
MSAALILIGTIFGAAAIVLLALSLVIVFRDIWCLWRAL